MIVRMWRGQAKATNADAYERFVTAKVFAELPAIPGHRGAYLLRRPIEQGDEVEFIAVTLWESLASIRGFAGSDIDRAVVEPEARAVLSGFDDFVRHFELAHAGPCA
jgi:heme-degrading monooxygenase HmoA